MLIILLNTNIENYVSIDIFVDLENNTLIQRLIFNKFPLIFVINELKF